MNTEEIWKPIPGYEGFYEVSTLGRVKSLDRFVLRKGIHPHRIRERMLKQYVNNHGYCTVHLCDANRNKRVLVVHRIVARAFCENPGRPDVNHLDGKKTNNRADNLEWTTPTENMRHAYRSGLIPSLKGDRRGFNILNGTDIPVIRSLRGIVPMRIIANDYGVTLGTIHAVMSRRSWSHIE